MAHTLTVYADTADDEVISNHGTYTTAADGGGTLALRGSTETAQVVGQQKPGDYYCHEAFESFDTSSLADSGITLTGADLSIYVAWNPTETAWTLQARAFDWGASVTTGDFRTRAQLSALDLLASLASGSLGTGAYRTLTAESAFLSAIVTDGTTRIVLCSDRHAAGTAPTNYELISYSTADAGGTTQDPKLVITYTVQNTATLSTTSSPSASVTKSAGLVRSATARSQAYLKDQIDRYRVACIADTHFCHDAARRSAYGMGVKSAQNITATATREPDAWHHLGDIIDYLPSEWNEAEDYLDGLNLYACLGTHDYDLYKYPEVSGPSGMADDLWAEVALTLASGVTAGNDTITVNEAVTGVVEGHTALLISDPEADGYTPQSNFEVLTVSSVNVGAKTITFTGNLTNSYDAGDHFRQGWSNQRGIDYMTTALSNTPMSGGTRKFYTVGNLLFVFLGIDRWHPDELSRNLWAANDLQWLESVVAAGDAANYNIFVHTHMSPSAETGTYDWEPSIVYWPDYVQAWFKRMCADYTVALWSNGHAHTSQLEADGLTSLTNGVSGWGDTYFWSVPALFQQYSDYKYQTSYLDFHDGSSTAVLTNWGIDSDGNLDSSPFRTRNITLPYAVDLSPRGAVETYQDGDYTVHRFTTSGTLLCPEGFSRSADILVVGGGGGGSQGGGGGGHYRTESDITITGNMAVVVGEGGLGGVLVNGVNGGTSSFGGIVSVGGGGGGSAMTHPGNPGACGGGGGFSSAGTTVGGTATEHQNGGDNGGYTGAPYPAGGGGGATGVGGDATSNSAAGAGGQGAESAISGASVGYCGGGGGGLYGDGTPGTATRGGGAGGDELVAPTAGTDGTGGGGGGGTNATGGARGGDGVVIIRYLTPVVTDSEFSAVPLAVPGITRSTSLMRSTTAPSVPALTRAVGLTRSAVSSAVASVFKSIPVLLTLEVVASATASLTREVGKIAAGTASAVATRQIAVGRSLSAVSSATGTITRAVSKVLSGISSATASLDTVARFLIKPLKSGLAFIRNVTGIAEIRAVTGRATKKYISGEVNVR